MKITPKDELLLDRWLRQNPDALKEVLTEYGRPFYGFLVVLLGEETKAHDYFCQTFLRALRSTALKNRDIAIPLELLRQVMNDILSAKPAAGAVDSQILMRLSADEDIQVRLLLSSKLLAGMNLEERIAILLRDVMELEISQMAYVMTLSESQVKSKLNEARIHFREKMSEALRSKDFYDLRQR